MTRTEDRTTRTREGLTNVAGATGLVGLVTVAVTVAMAPVTIGAGLAMLLPEPGTRADGGVSTWLLVACAAVLAVVVGWFAGLVAARWCATFLI